MRRRRVVQVFVVVTVALVIAAVAWEWRHPRGAALLLGTTPGYELLVGVTATRPRHVVVEGHTISFSEGWQIGSKEIAVETVLEARRSAG